MAYVRRKTFAKIPIELLEHPEADTPQRKDEKPKRDGLKSCRIGQSAAKPRTGEGSTTKSLASDWLRQWWASEADEDIVWSLRKRREANALAGVAPYWLCITM